MELFTSKSEAKPCSPRYHKLSFLCHTWNNSKTKAKSTASQTKEAPAYMKWWQNKGHTMLTSLSHCWCDRGFTRHSSQLQLLQPGALVTICCFLIQSRGAGSPWTELLQVLCLWVNDRCCCGGHSVAVIKLGAHTSAPRFLLPLEAQLIDGLANGYGYWAGRKLYQCWHYGSA